jgi:hypothetical protein
MIISLYAGGMTVRDISHHLAHTLGTELSHDTISKISDEVAEEVKAWQVPTVGGDLPDHLPGRAGGEGPGSGADGVIGLADFVRRREGRGCGGGRSWRGRTSAASTF